jgi:predicted small metal-binding protein
MGKGGLTMDQVLRCTDTGLDCDFVICGQTKDEVLNNTQDHMRDFHKKEFSRDLYEKARDAIHEGDCEKEIQTDQILVF